MSFQNPATRIKRRSVEGMEGMHSKMFDPPTTNPDTPDLVNPTSPVPEVMAAAGFMDKNPPDPPHTAQRQLMHGMTLPTWDGQNMNFYLFRDPDGIGAAKMGTFPAPTNRLPRGVIFHCETAGSGPPPHTIHWHGQEPTPMNDGVGHCSMELGHYTYQWQPNFIGSYFYHCHRNTVQHFEFGLYGFTIIDPPDAFFASIAANNPDGTVVLNNVPIGNCRPEAGYPFGRRRTAANLDPAINPAFAIFGQNNFNPIDSPDPEAINPNLPAWLKFQTDPHAYTVGYDVEALWVLDDRDINWSNLAPGARATYPQQGTIPGVNDNFHGDAGGAIGPNDFFAFNDFRSTHFYVTGVPIPDDTGTLQMPGRGAIPHGIVIPPELMCGVAGVQVSVNARVDQNILLRVLNGAYNNARVTFPVDVVIIAWDGRALGVPPFGNYNEPVLVPAGTPMEWSVARRFDCMLRSSVPINDVATIEFIDTLRRDVRFTARIPINIGAGQDVLTWAISGTVTDVLGAPMAGVAVSTASLTLGGSEQRTVLTDAQGNFNVSGLVNGTYQVTPSRAGVSFDPPTRVVTIATDGMTGVSFAATVVPAATYAVSGKVATAAGLGIGATTITLSGSASLSTTTDGNGNYSFTGLANGNYTLTPARTGYTFTPTSMPVLVADNNVAGRNFTGTTVAPAGSIISGKTITRTGNPIPGATVTLLNGNGGALVTTVTTNAFGEYSLSGVANGRYVIVPSLAGYVFSPTQKSLRVSGSNVTGRDFIGTAVAGGLFTISGKTLGKMRTAISGATVNLLSADGLTVLATAVTNASGEFSFNGLADGWYVVSPSLAGYRFAPARRSVRISGRDATTHNFRGIAIRVR